MTKPMVVAAIVLLLVTGCGQGMFEPVPSVEDALLARGIAGPDDFIRLSVCEQVRVYAEIGADHLDMDHGYALVPAWMYERLEQAPREAVAACIVALGRSVMGELDESRTWQNQNRADRIHALIFKAQELRLFEYPGVLDFARAAMCDKRIDRRASIVPIYHAESGGDLYDFPTVEEAFALYCP